MKTATMGLKTGLGLLTGAVLALSGSVRAADEVALKGAEVGVWTMDYDAALKLAKKEEVPLMLNFTGSDWCGWCKLMDKEVFAQKEWKDYAGENVVLVTIDFPNDKSIVPEEYVDRNKELQKQFEVRGYPSYVILDSDGETKLGQLGAGRDKTPASFIEEFKGVVRMSPANIEAYAKANPDKAEAYKEAIADYKKANEELEAWIETRPEQNEENMEKFKAFQERIKKAAAKLDEF